MSEQKNIREKKTEKEKTKQEPKGEVREMSLHYKHLDQWLIDRLKEVGVDSKKIERLLQKGGSKVLVKVDLEANKIVILDDQVGIENRKKQFLAEKIVKRIKPSLKTEFPKIVQTLLSEQDEDWLKTVLELLDNGAKVGMDRTKGRCVWIVFEKGRRNRSLLIE